MSLKVECCMGTFVDEILYAEFLFPVSINAEAETENDVLFRVEKNDSSFSMKRV